MRGMNIQGYLTNSGLPYTGTVGRIWARVYEVGGSTVMWRKDYMSVPVNNGFFKIFLALGWEGDSGSRPLWLSGLDWTRQYEVEFEVDGEVLSPRQKILSVPYAFMTQTVSRGWVEAASMTSRSDHSSPVTYGAMSSYEAGRWVAGEWNSFAYSVRGRYEDRATGALGMYQIYHVAGDTGDPMNYWGKYYGVYGSGETYGLYGYAPRGVGVRGTGNHAEWGSGVMASPSLQLIGGIKINRATSILGSIFKHAVAATDLTDFDVAVIGGIEPVYPEPTRVRTTTSTTTTLASLSPSLAPSLSTPVLATTTTTVGYVAPSGPSTMMAPPPSGTVTGTVIPAGEPGATDVITIRSGADRATVNNPLVINNSAGRSKIIITVQSNNSQRAWVGSVTDGNFQIMRDDTTGDMDVGYLILRP